MSMGMPIPMPAGMPMIPGLVGLTPRVTSFLPGMGVDVMKLPRAKPSQMIRLKNGDTLDLTAILVRRTIKKHSYVMYGFNGQIPGPMLRVQQNATVTIRFPPDRVVADRSLEAQRLHDLTGKFDLTG